MAASSSIILTMMHPFSCIICISLLIFSDSSADAFSIVLPNSSSSKKINTTYSIISSTNNNHVGLLTSTSPAITGTTTSLQCICINCSRVTSCQAYHFVEAKHSQPHINKDPKFTPCDGSPTIHVNIRTNRENDDEIGRLWSEHVEETRKAEETSASASTAAATASPEDERLFGKEKYDLSVKTTYEYDVVACEDFVEENGCWVRNMPEEIKLANPNFVPT